MKLTRRLYQSEEDYWRIRQFLREVFLLNGRREVSWPLYRFDYWRWHGTMNMGHGPLEKTVFIWETSDGRIASVLNPENDGVGFMQVHPAFLTCELEEEMLLTAEECLPKLKPDGKRRLWVIVHEENHIREKLLQEHGFGLQDAVESHHSRVDLDSVPHAAVAEGYTIRSLGDVDEHPARSWVSWKAFHPDEPDEKYEGWTWYQNIQRCPLYRRDLDIVAAMPNGEIAAFCTVWFDDVTRSAAFEPVGVHPDHQHKGLGRAVMYEGLRRLRQLGANLATVGSEEPGPCNFYSSIGFSTIECSRGWLKEF